jgi:tRNA modification GTPase
MARLAEKGEFTKRAFLNSKIDLAQAEATGELIASTSLSGIAMARNMMEGVLSKKLDEMNNALSQLLTDIEASFIADDSEIPESSVLSCMNALLKNIDAYLDGAEAAPSMYSGIHTVIAGLPNAGKSSLFNALLGYSRAIVHEEAGTTRDVVKEHICIDGLDFILCDTAGIKITSNGPEQIGIEKTIEALKQADLILYVVDATKGISKDEHKWLSLGKRTILVANKTDLNDGDIPQIHGIEVVKTSAKHKQGIDRLFQSMIKPFPSETPQVFIERHIYLLKKTKAAIESGIRAIKENMTLDVVAMDIKDALLLVREILGKDINEDIMESIFSKFCIGK